MFLDHEAQRDLVGLNNRILADHRIVLSKDSVILDFGCGSGRHTYEYRDSGYHNTFGYDIANYLVLRQPEDIAFFRLDSGGASSGGPMSKIPWPDATFDFVQATSVFEHVMQQELAYREIARVLKPGGVFLNNFPSRWRPLEPHIYVPFGGATHSKWWFRLWAMAGIRNGFQRGLSAAETAEKNHTFSRTGLIYPSNRAIKRVMLRTFKSYEGVEASFIRHSPGRSRYMQGPLRLFPPLIGIYRAMHSHVILARM